MKGADGFRFFSFSDSVVFRQREFGMMLCLPNPGPSEHLVDFPTQVPGRGALLCRESTAFHCFTLHLNCFTLFYIALHCFTLLLHCSAERDTIYIAYFTLLSSLHRCCAVCAICCSVHAI